MAILFDAGTDYLKITSSPLDYNNPYTMMGWYYLETDRDYWNCLFQVCLNTTTPQNSDALFLNATGTTLRIFAAVGGGGSGVNGSELSVQTWTHLAIVRESLTSIKLYKNGSLDITVTSDMSGRPSAARQHIAVFYYEDNYETVDYIFPGRVAALKAWSKSMTQADVQREMYNIRPVDVSSLYGFWPCLPGSGERTRDYSGNGYNWTENGTLTDENPPPVSWGAPVWTLPFYSAATPEDIDIAIKADNAAYQGKGVRVLG